MIDVPFAVKTWLLLDSITLPDGTTKQNQLPTLLNSMFTTGGTFPNNDPNRVYVGHLVPGFDPKYGPGVVLRIGSGASAGTGGGSAHPEIPLLMPRMQLTTWAGVNQYDIARQIYRSIYDWIQRSNGIDLGQDTFGNNIGFILSCTEQVEAQDVDDVHTGFATTVSFWKLMMREN